MFWTLSASPFINILSVFLFIVYFLALWLQMCLLNSVHVCLGSGCSVLPMKLAERPRPKSATTSPSPSSQHTTSTPRITTAAGLKSHVQASKISGGPSSVQSRTSSVDERLTRRTPPSMDSCSLHNSNHSAVSSTTSTRRDKQIIFF